MKKFPSLLLLQVVLLDLPVQEVFAWSSLVFSGGNTFHRSISRRSRYRCGDDVARCQQQQQRQHRRRTTAYRSATSEVEDTAAMLRSVTFCNILKDDEPDLLCDFLMEVGACSTSITDSDYGTPLEQPVFVEPDPNNDDPLMDGLAWLSPRWNRCNVTAHFPSSVNLGEVVKLIADVFPDQYPLEDFDDVTRVPNRDWVIHVQKGWRPIVIGDFLLRFPWHTEKDIQKAVAELKDRKWIELKLQGGVAFGTGEHPTTQLCLEWLQAQIQSILADSSQSNNIRVMDYGTGSGVLGMAACALSTDTIQSVGIDIDVDAVQIANANAALNGLSLVNYLPPLSKAADDESKSILLKAYAQAQQRLDGQSDNGATQLILPDELDTPTCDICVANILAEPLVGLASTLAGLIKPGGELAMSGILPQKADMVIEAYSELFDNVELERKMGGWVLITGTRKAES